MTPREVLRKMQQHQPVTEYQALAALAELVNTTDNLNEELSLVRAENESLARELAFTGEQLTRAQAERRLAEGVLHAVRELLPAATLEGRA